MFGVLVFYLGQLRTLRFQVSPVGHGTLVYLGVTPYRCFLMPTVLAMNFIFGIKGQAHLNPLLQNRDFFVLQLSEGRHFVILVLVGNHFEKKAGFGLFQIDRWSDLSSF